MADRTPILPAHIENTVRAIAEVHAEHHQKTTPMQRVVNSMTAGAGRPAAVGILTLTVIGWMAANLAVFWSGQEPWDPPPFPWLSGAVSLVALYTSLLILTTQRHDDELASHREQLTLELAILNEQKSAKIIQLIEEMRRDSPHLANRMDHEAHAMSTSADPQAVLNAIRTTHQELSP